MMQSLSAVSYNINGTRRKEHVIDELACNYDIVCLQEHLLSSANTNLLKRSANHVVFVSAARTTFGRPSGGLACILNRNSVACYSPVLFHSDPNILAVRINDLVIVNVYLPCDRKSVQSLNRFAKTCSVLQKLLESVSNQGYRFLIAGDFNADLLSSNIRSDLIFDSLPQFKLVEKTCIYSYLHHSGSQSNIDHVVCSPGLPVSTVTVHEDHCDLDHLPISFVFQIPICTNRNALQAGRRWVFRRNWNKINLSLYISTLAMLLATIQVPFHLLQLSCKSSNDKNTLNDYYLKLVSCLKTAELTAVPRERVRRNTRKPEWSWDPELKSIKNKAKFWLRIWVSCGRPSEGVIHQIKQKTKLEYKKYLRSTKSKISNFPLSKSDWQKVINSEKLDDSFATSPISAGAWHSYYSKVFSSVNYHVHSVFSKLLTAALPVSLSQTQILSVELSVVQQAVKRLKSNSLDCDGISANHLKVDCPLLFQHLQLLFQMCLCASAVPDSFLCGSVTSILKRGKPPSDCSSYRPITVSCNLSKVFEYVLLPSISSAHFGENQLGFSSGVGCQQAHRVLINLLIDATKKGYELHLCALDLSKAFDSVVHSQALFSLFSHGINLSLVSLLRYWYANSFLRIKAEGVISDSKIPVRCGVRQGAVLSPSIFKLCISSVLSSIPTTCIFQAINLSYIAYADDILLISRTRKGLSVSVSTVATNLSKIGLSLNLSKCEYLSFNSNGNSPLDCASFSVPCVSSFRWLGINIAKNLKSLREQAVANCKKKIQVSYSKIVANRGKYSRKTLAKLYSVFTDHSILFLSGVYPILGRKNTRSLRSYYFRFSRFLLYLPPWYRNRNLVSVFGLPDITEKLVELADKLPQTVKALPAHHGFVRLLH